MEHGHHHAPHEFKARLQDVNIMHSTPRLLRGWSHANILSYLDYPCKVWIQKVFASSHDSHKMKLTIQHM